MPTAEKFRRSVLPRASHAAEAEQVDSVAAVRYALGHVRWADPQMVEARVLDGE